MITLPLEAPCPCGSGRSVKNCCIPDVPPVSMAPNSWKDLNIQTGGLDQYDRPIGIPRSLKIAMTLRQAHQIDPDISVFRDMFEPLTGHSKSLAILEDALHAVRYHQRQFLYRMRLADLENLPTKTFGTDQLIIHLVDFPQLFELEAFLFRVMSSLDVITRLMSEILGWKPLKYTEFKKRINNDYKVKHGQKVRAVIKDHLLWIDKVRHLRNAIAHEGDFEEYQSLAISAYTSRSTHVEEERADVFCITVWKSLLLKKK